MEELRAQWGRNVENGRKLLNLSQTQLAELCGVKQQTISLIEKGGLAPRDELKLDIAEALHQEVRQLFPLIRPISRKKAVA